MQKLQEMDASCANILDMKHKIQDVKFTISEMETSQESKLQSSPYVSSIIEEIPVFTLLVKKGNLKLAMELTSKPYLNLSKNNLE